MSEAPGPSASDDKDTAGEKTPDVPDTPARMQQLLAEITSISASGPMHHPIFAKFEPEHVTQFLNYAHENETAEARFRSSSRWFRLGYIGIGVGVLVLLTVFLLPDNRELYFEILKGVAIFAGGVGGGYGLRTYQERGRQG